MTPIDRLTAAQSLVAALLRDFIDCPEPDCGDHDLPIAKAIPFTDDLAAVLAVVAAARAIRERLTIDPGNVVSWAEWDTLDERLAAIEGDKP